MIDASRARRRGVGAVALACVVVAGAAASLPGDPIKDDAGRSAYLLEQARSASGPAARSFYAAYLAFYEGESGTREALAGLVHHSRQMPSPRYGMDWDTSKAIGKLRELAPLSRAYRVAMGEMGRINGWTFCKTPVRAEPVRQTLTLTRLVAREANLRPGGPRFHLLYLSPDRAMAAEAADGRAEDAPQQWWQADGYVLDERGLARGEPVPDVAPDRWEQIGGAMLGLRTQTQEIAGDPTLLRRQSFDARAEAWRWSEQVFMLDVDLSRPGWYVLVESIGDDMRYYHPIRAGSFDVVAKVVGGDGLAYAFDASTGEAVGDVAVTVEVSGRTIEAKTDASGVARFALPAGLAGGEGDEPLEIRVTARRGNEAHRCRLWWLAQPTLAMVHISTDRPVYRRGQTVSYKAVWRDFADGRYRFTPGERVVVRLEDDDGRPIDRAEPAWNDAGTISGSFVLSDEARLGGYTIAVEKPRPYLNYFSYYWTRYLPGGPDDVWSRSFEVEAYRKPQARVAMSFPRGAEAVEAVNAATGQPVRRHVVRVSAEYLFGGPVVGAEVEVRVTRRRVWRWRLDALGEHDWEEPRVPLDGRFDWFTRHMFDLRDDDGDGYEFGRYLFDRNEEDEASVTATTGPDGSAELAFDAMPDADDGYTLRARVTDLSGYDATAEGKLGADDAGVRVEIGVDRVYHLEGEAVTGRIGVRDAAGKPIADTPLIVTGYIVEHQKRAAAGALYADEEPPAERVRTLLEPVVTREVRTDASGRAALELRPPMAGDLLVRVRAVEAGGGRAVAERAVRVYSAKTPPTESETWTWGTNGGVQMLPDRATYTAGQTMKLMVRTERAPLRGLLTVEGESLHLVRPIVIDRPLQIVEVPVEAAWAPNCFVKITAFKDGEQHFAGHEVLVYPAQRMIDVKVTPNREAVRPGEKLTVAVAATIAGRGVASEVELAIVDESIYQLADDNVSDLRTFFMMANLGDSAHGGTIGFDDSYRSFRGALVGTDAAGYAFADVGDGDRGPHRSQQQLFWGGDDAVEPRTVGPDVRLDFRDTAVYRAQVKTDAAGRAVVELPTPANLTAWRIVARAVSGADRFGVGRSDVVSRQDVMVRLALPRFAVAGDRVSIATVVHNETDGERTFTLTLDTDGCKADAARKTLRVAAHGVGKADWLLGEITGDAIRVRAQAIADGGVERGADAVEQAIPVKTRAPRSTVVASGRVDERWSHRFALPVDAAAGSAELEVYVAGARLEAMRDVLPSLAGYPYGCVEQTMSRFVPAVVASSAMKRMGIEVGPLDAELPQMIRAGLGRLYAFQHADGGWGWWMWDESDRRMTAYVVAGLAMARAAGVEVEPHAIERGAAWLGRIEGPDAYTVYAMALAGVDVGDRLDRLAAALRDGGGGRDGGVDDIVTRAYLILAGRRELAEGWAIKPPDDDGPDAVRAMALAVRALASVDAKDGRIEPLLDWLMRRRRGGWWHSTLDTAYVVFAMAALGKADDPPAIAVTLNGRPLAIADGRVRVGAEALAAGDNDLVVTAAGEGRLYASATLSYRTAADPIPAAPGACAVERVIRVADGVEIDPRTDRPRRKWRTLASGDAAPVGAELRIALIVRPRRPMSFVMIDSPIPASAEPIEPGRYGYDGYDDQVGEVSYLAPSQSLDDRALFPMREMGVFERGEFGLATGFEHRVRLSRAGVYRVRPARAFDMYQPDRSGHSEEFVLRVVDRP